MAQVVGQFEHQDATGPDFIVNTTTGRPVSLSGPQITRLKRLHATIKADEQEDADFWALSDNYISTKFIYPDGEDEVPKDYLKLNMSRLGPDLSDRHIGADGKITVHPGPVFGVFREVQVRSAQRGSLYCARS